LSYNFNTMHWWDRLDTLQAQYAQQGGVPNDRYGLTLDQATAPWANADPKIQQYLADSQKSKEEGGVFGDFTRALGEVVDMGDPLFKALAYPYKQLSTNVLSPITHVIPVLFNEDWQNQINADSTWDALFDGRSWHQIMMQSEKDSVGRGFWKSVGVLDKGLSLQDLDHLGEFGTSNAELKEMESDWRFTALSGTTDFLSVMFLDPLYVTAKAAKAAHAFSTVVPLKPGMLETAEDFDNLMVSEPVSRFLKWTEGQTPEAIANHRFLKRNPERGQIADLLSHATTMDKDLIFRLVAGDERALADLQRTAPAIAQQYLRMRGQVEFFQLKTLPSLTATVRSDGKKIPLSAEQKKRLIGPRRQELEQYARENRTTLKLNDSEFNPHLEGPFSSRTLPESAHRVYNTYSTIYKPLGDAQQTRMLFNISGQLERTPDDLTKALKEYQGFKDAVLTSQRHLRVSELAKPLKGQRRVNRDRLGTGLAADEPIPSRFVSPWAETRFKGQKPIRFADDAGAKVTKGDMRAAVPGRPAPEPFMGPVEQKYAMWDYDVAKVADHQAKMKGQLDLFDDYLTPELRQLDEGVGFYQRLIDDAAGIDRTGVRPGIFGSARELPKGGAYASLAESAVKVGRFMDKAYQRRYDGELRHYGFLSRPVYYAAKLQDGLSRGLVPTHFRTADPEGWKDVDIWLKRVPDLSSAARGAWVRQLMAATEDTEKLRIVEQMEATVIRHMLHTQGVHDYETIESITAVTLGSRKAYVGRMADTILERSAQADPHASADGAYSAVNSTKGLAPAGLTPDGVAIVPGPQVATQLLDEHPLLPVDELYRAFRRDGKWLRGEGSLALRDNIVEWTQLANRIWKTSVLARVGYPIRTVSDEVLLASAALGSLVYYAGAIEGTARTVRNVPTRLGNAARRAENRRARFKRQLPEHELKRPPHQRGREDVWVGKDSWMARGFAGGPTGDINRSLVSADQRDLFQIYDNLLHQLRKGTSWGVLDPKKEVTHLAAWTHALNLQLGQDKLARQFLLGEDYASVLKWLKSSPEGQAYAKSMPHMAHQPEDWVKSVAFMVDSYTKGDMALARAAAEGKVTPAMLRRIPVENRPPVHGGQIDYSRGVGAANGAMSNITNGFYQIASKLPTDKLVRHPVADMLYQKRLREMVAHMEAQGVRVAEHPEKLYRAEEAARRWTVKEMDRTFKDHLFSSPQTALRFVMPFFGAWRASIARWATAIAEDPSLVARAAQGWQGLHKPFDVVDENGLPVSEQLDENGRPRQSASEIYGMNTKNKIVMRLPEAIAKKLGGTPFVPGGASFEDAPGRVIPLKSFNTVLQGDPWYNAGFGPFVTIPIAQIIRGDDALGIVPTGDAKPALGKLAQETGVLPFGAGESWRDQAAPSWQKRATAGEEGLENRQYTTAFINILRVETARAAQGKRPPLTDLSEIRRKADDLTRLRKWESFLLPFSAQPVYYAKEWEKLPKGYQFLAAKFRQYRAAADTPEQGEEEFLRDFPDMWIYMQATSDNKSGIPANSESWGKAKKVKYLASKVPDIFDSAAGVQNHEYKKFDAAVYDAEMNQEWNPATGEKFREVRDPATLVPLAKAGEGWKKYSKMMDYLRGELEARGLQTVNDPGAQDLKDLKSDYIDYIGETNPDWKDAYGSPNLGRKRRILEQARIVAADKNLPTDPHRTLELQSLRSYLAGRDWFAEQLATRGATEQGSLNINAKSNQDLLRDWDDYREYLAHKDTRFSEIWLDRYFGNDYFQELK